MISGTTSAWKPVTDLVSVREANALRLISPKATRLEKYELSLDDLSVESVKKFIELF